APGFPCLRCRDFYGREHWPRIRSRRRRALAQDGTDPGRVEHHSLFSDASSLASFAAYSAARGSVVLEWGLCPQRLRGAAHFGSRNTLLQPTSYCLLGRKVQFRISIQRMQISEFRRPPCEISLISRETCQIHYNPA